LWTSIPTKIFLSSRNFFVIFAWRWFVLDGCFFSFQIYTLFPERQIFFVICIGNAQEEASSAEEQLASNKHSAHTEIV